MDGVTIGIAVSVALGVGLLLAGWIWDTRNVAGRLESDMNKQFGLLQKDFDKQISEVREDLERQGTMIEPFWQTLCTSLPSILKMHNSPDPLDAVLNGNPNMADIDNIEDELKCRLIEAQKAGDDGKALALTLAIVAVRVKRKQLLKRQGSK